MISCEEKRVSQKKSFLSGLALHFPFLFSIFGKDFAEHNGSISACLPTKTSEDARPNSESMSLNLEDGILEAKVDEKETDPCRYLKLIFIYKLHSFTNGPKNVFYDG